jgi:hypothetical protein
MTRVSMKRLTEGQIHSVLEFIRLLAEYCEDDTVEEFSNRSIDDVFEIEWPRRGNSLRIRKILEDAYQIQAQPREWKRILSVQTTTRELAEFVLERSGTTSIRPVRMLGEECLPAGVFRSLESISRDLTTTRDSIGPSSNLQTVLSRRKMGAFGLRLAAILPDDRFLRATFGDRRKPLWRRCLGVLVVCTFFGLFVGFPSEIPGVSVFRAIGGLAVLISLFSIVAMPIVMLIDWFLSRNQSLFAPGVDTYRDLSVLAAKHIREREEAAA